MPRAERSRIVSLAPSSTSILVALGARHQLVGVSKWCKFVAAVRGLPELGDCWSLDPESVMRLRPTLVIGSVPFKAETVSRLLEQPVNFLAQNPRSLADVYRDIRMLGALTGRAPAAEKLVRHMEQGFAAIARRAPRSRVRPRVYCEAWPHPRISSPPWVAELVEICGGRFVCRPGARVSDTEVARARPEVIALAWTATGDRARVDSALHNPHWSKIPAVRDHRVHVVRDELLNTPGPPLLRGAAELFRILHPQLAPRRRSGT